MNILSIDDSKTIREAVRNLAEVVGATLFEAENGLKGIEVLEARSRDIDLVLLDMEMPVMDGMACLKKIKSDRRFNGIPVIMLTSVSNKLKVVEAIRAGAKQYITKPFSDEELLTKIVQTLGVEGLGR
jgi:two-component system chemotaxis response regulator CheY